MFQMHAWQLQQSLIAVVSVLRQIRNVFFLLFPQKKQKNFADHSLLSVLLLQGGVERGREPKLFGFLAVSIRDVEKVWSCAGAGVGIS